MSHAPASLSGPFDPQQGGLLLANMLSAMLDGEPGIQRFPGVLSHAFLECRHQTYIRAGA